MTLTKLAQLNILLDEYCTELGDRTMKFEDIVAVEHAKDLVFQEIRSSIYKISVLHDMADMDLKGV